MGLLDFFQNGGGNNAQSNTNTNPPAVPDFASIQQSYTNQSLANVSYPMAPMASSNPYAPAPSAVAPQTAMPATNMQPVPAEQPMVQMPVTPVNNFATESTPTSVSPAMPEVAPAPEATQPEEKDVPSYEYVDPSKHPVIPTVVPNQGHTQTMPEGIKITTFDAADMPAVPTETPAPEQPAEVPVNEPPVETPVTDLGAQPITDQSSQTTENLMPGLPSLDQIQPDMTQMQQVPSEQVQPDTNLNSTIPADWNPVQNVQPQIPSMEPVQNLDMPQIPVVQDNLVPEQPVVTDSSNTAAPVEQTTEPQPEQTPAPEAPAEDLSGLEIGVGTEAPDMGTMPEIPAVEPVATPEVSLTEPEAVSSVDQQPESMPMPEQAPEAPVEVTGPEMNTINNSLDQPVEMPVAEVPAMDPVPAVEAAPVAAPVQFEMSYFKTIGFIGLNTTQTNLKVVEKISDLSAKLAEHAEVFILDSAKGYAKSVFDSAKANQIELMGMFLKPYHSGYSDEAELGDYDNFTVMMFSNTGDKVKNLIKESDLLVMPEVTGLNNLGILFDIWATSSMYPGQNKPLLLIGKGWTNILTQLKSLFKLSDSDLNFVTVCQTTEEALAKITELDRSFISREVKQPKKVIDLREEDDEEGLFV